MQIRLIGCGAMGSAIAQTLVEQGKTVSLYDKYKQRAEVLAREIQATIADSPLEGLTFEDYLLLAVKPQDFHHVAEELKEFTGALIVSILTGISTEQLKHAFPTTPVLRMVPNVAVRYGDGIVALAEDPQLSSYKEQIEETFSPLGMVRWLPEKNMNAMTALGGSGPAFVFTILEAMVDAAIELGFSADLAYELVKQMVGGALTTLYESNELPCELRWKVCSPSGTTSAGLRSLEKHKVRSALIEAFAAACTRAEELGANN